MSEWGFQAKSMKQQFTYYGQWEPQQARTSMSKKLDCTAAKYGAFQSGGLMNRKLLLNRLIPQKHNYDASSADNKDSMNVDRTSDVKVTITDNMLGRRLHTRCTARCVLRCAASDSKRVETLSTGHFSGNHFQLRASMSECQRM